MVYLTSAARRLDRRSLDRPAPRRALRRHPHRRRPLLHGRPGAHDLLPRPVPDRASARACSRATSASSSASSTRQDDQRRDAGFSIFYMGINLGAFIAPLVCGYLGQKVNWHLGFAAAGVGMTLGVDPVRRSAAKHLGDAGPASRAGGIARRPPPQLRRQRARSGGARPVVAGRARRRHGDRRDPDHRRRRSPTRPAYFLLFLIARLLRLAVLRRRLDAGGAQAGST